MAGQEDCSAVGDLAEQQRARTAPRTGVRTTSRCATERGQAGQLGTADDREHGKASL